MQKFYFIILLLWLSLAANAQTISLGTNAVDWVNLGTANVEVGISVGQHFSIITGGRYNPWTFNSKRHDAPMHNNVKVAYAGARYWPWYVFSGWWVGLKGQYEQFMQGGFWRPMLEEGTAIGAGLSGGYTWMLHKHLNLEFGIGMWGGRYTDYSKYQCSDCVDLITSGPRNFLRFDDLVIALVYVF
ncbi:MAG: DUF3575 domain-containing protein [Bacteroidales bacterium]|nr:DUF3575 domain-containing protein [Bacteroidales bacterium]